MLMAPLTELTPAPGPRMNTPKVSVLALAALVPLIVTVPVPVDATVELKISTPFWLMFEIVLLPLPINVILPLPVDVIEELVSMRMPWEKSPAGAVVFLAGEYAYKLKRAVLFAFMDFSTVEKRRTACMAEIAINRPHAPSIYLDAPAITRADGYLRFGGTYPVGGSTFAATGSQGLGGGETTFTLGAVKRF